MPQYTYECPECKTRWTETRTREDNFLNRSKSNCPKHLFLAKKGRRVFDPGSVVTVFRGGGWARKAGADGES